MKPLKVCIILLISVAIGFVNGMLGGGGGMLCVPLLAIGLKLTEKESHANAIFVILLTSIASCVVYLTKGYFDVSQGFFVMEGVIFGGIIGAMLLTKLSNKVISVIFYLLMLGAGIRLLF